MQPIGVVTLTKDRADARLRGRLDERRHDELERILAYMLRLGVTDLVIDLSDVDGIDAGSIQRLADAKWQGEDLGVVVHVVGRPDGIDLVGEPGSVAFAPKPGPPLY